MRATKILGYFFIVFCITALILTLIMLPLEYIGVRVPKHYEFIYWGLIPFLVAVYCVRRMIKVGKFDR
jgi:hypothetical protein